MLRKLQTHRFVLLKRFRVFTASVLLWAMVACLNPLLAQTNTAAVYGSVIDTQGLAVAGAAITVRSSDLSAARTTATDAHGRFSFNGLVPGAYVVEAHGKGLMLRQPIHLTLKDAADYIMKLPKAEQQVEEWQTAIEVLIRAAEGRDFLMHARIGVLRALYRNVDRV